MKKLLMAVFLLSLSMLSLANTVLDCGFVYIKNFYVQADRSDGSPHNNILLLGGFESGACQDVYGYLENEDEAYDSIFAMALTAYTTKTKIRIVLDPNPNLARAGAKRIQWLHFQAN